MKIYKKILCLFIILGQLVILASCLNDYNEEPQNGKVLQNVNFNYFNTVSYIYSYAGHEQDVFAENSNKAFELLGEYHKLFDIYYEYSGINNLCTVNKKAGVEAVEVDQRLIDFLIYTKEIYSITGGETNVMLGSVLKLWHDARETASNGGQKYVPSMEDLTNANQYVDINLLEIDDEKNLVFIKDKNARIDVGAIGKGYATEKVAEYLESIGCYKYVLNFGGNIRIIGNKDDGSGWNTGVTNPHDPSTYSLIINISDTACVTSGDYERYYFYEGVKYHHIIDKDTLMPADYFSSVTIITKNSGLADALSTALFAMSYDDGKKLIESLEGVEVIWIYKDGSIVYTDGVSVKQ